MILEQETGGLVGIARMRFADLTIMPNGRDIRIAIDAPGAIQGPTYYADRTLGEIQACL